MTYFFKQCIFGLLVLVIAASPVQSAMAFDPDPDDQAMLVDCQQAPMQSTGVVDQQACESCLSHQESACVNEIHLGCVAQFCQSMIQKSYLFIASAITARKLKFGIDNAALESHYPGLIIRPPRV